jgi:CheY-like chemotaxis protein
MTTPTVLVVDDGDDVRELARLMLESRGFSVLEAADGGTALKMLEGDFLRIDVLFTDVLMSGNLNGFALAERARAIRPDLAIVLTSGYVQPELARAIASADFQFLRKPYSLHDLLRTIAEAVKSADARKSPPQADDNATEGDENSEGRRPGLH